jgi:tetratricopeptide (TPR) repeat protein
MSEGGRTIFSKFFSSDDEATRKRRLHVLLSLLLLAITVAVYWQVRGHDFITYDDNLYITGNEQVKGGLTVDGIVWAFTTGHSANWHPLTWFSHMLDVELFGLNPGWHHLMSVLFHVANTLLLFYVLRRMTGALWQSAFVAAVFALHPLHVESVAWAAERKDVLSTLFWMLTMMAYVRYVEKPGTMRYLLVALALALGLMAKPMLVTLPLVLLLLDYWPLGRFQIKETEAGGKPKGRRIDNQKARLDFALRLVREKVPLIVLAVASSVVTYIVQQSAGAFKYSQPFPLKLRFDNALLSYVDYIAKSIWPTDLAVLYPHRGMSPTWQIVMLPGWKTAIAGLFLIAATFVAIKAARRLPYVAVGWLWYVITLIPVIGIIQVGTQAMADRYMYIPLIGLSMIAAWGVPTLLRKFRERKVVLAVWAPAVLAAFTVITWIQVGYWKDTISLFEHTIAVTSNNPVAQYSLGYAFHVRGRYAEAAPHYAEAYRIAPTYKEAQENLVAVLQAQGKPEEAAEAENNRGTLLGRQGKLVEAVAHLTQALRLKPDYADAHNNLGIVLAMQGKDVDAVSHFSEAVRIKPDFWNARYNLGIALRKQGKLAEAIAEFREALRIKPDYAEARTALEKALQLEKESPPSAGKR